MTDLPPDLVPRRRTRWRETLVIIAVGLLAVATSAFFVLALSLVL